ncbi:MAG: hypothetical protein ACRDHZ_18225, partial [Ktedonobacteraceae bacterium]
VYTYRPLFPPRKGVIAIITHGAPQILSIDVPTITINGKKLLPGLNSASLSGGSTGGNGETNLSDALLDQPGTWTVTLALTKTNLGAGPNAVASPLLTATFTFTVPA